MTADHARGARAWPDRPEKTPAAKDTQDGVVPGCKPPAWSKQSTHQTHSLTTLQSRSAVGPEVSARALALVSLCECSRAVPPDYNSRGSLRLLGAAPRQHREKPIPLGRRRALPLRSSSAASGSVRAGRLLPRPQPWLLGSGFLVPREVSPLQVGAGCGPIGDAAFPGAARACTRP